MSARCIDDDQARLFHEQGFLVVRGLLAGAELEALRRETATMVAHPDEVRPGDDVAYARHAETGRTVPFRIEYVVDKSPACRALLGHPFVLHSVEKLQGPSFVPTWDSMVFKLEGAGASIPWHRDQVLDYSPDRPIFNVDFYLDGSDLTNCLWAIPGSHRWPNEEALATVERLGDHEFGSEGAVPLPMEPGDVLFHDILVVHGSPAATSGLRRVLYYEFRPAEIEQRFGPHVPEYVPLKQRVLLACLRHRAGTPYAHGEDAFQYRPAPPFSVQDLGAGEEPETYRYPHEQFFAAA